MRKLSVLAAAQLLALSTGPSMSEGAHGLRILVSEDAVRRESVRLYSDLLNRACRKGWHYPRSQIESGFKRHFEELKLQILDQGLTIIFDTKANNLPQSIPDIGSCSQTPTS
ncbi:hypothetical protein LHFGNBLO_003531 [Mesorhizobium sp. AR10]|uniref:hypothetical protein n=1 Tax=Mesorhizobium sp. AR10 TaxID=2865839 RepID=UPI00215EA494|nr:hypothetical protein [Mesorhizobium sp. AR10]UVK36594.1 hypothetical protein LHFGNBLO_003531 [Mesorhizobium sp. AR10]